MDLLSIKSDLSAEKDGIWLECPLGSGTPRLECRICRMGTPAMQAFIEQESRPHLEEIRAGKAVDLVLDITYRAMARFVLVDWRHLTDGGVEIPYSVEKAAELLSNEAFHDFREWVATVAVDAQRYRVRVQEESLGNSEPSSGGSTPGDGMSGTSRSGPETAERHELSPLVLSSSPT